MYQNDKYESQDNESISQSDFLTKDVEVHEVWADRLGGHLTLVDARVPDLGVANLENPVLGVRGVDDLVALVGGVGVATHRQDV